MTNEIRISVITVTFNAAQALKMTIDSVLAQDYRNIEYIIIDGASTDSSQQIAEAYAKEGKLLWQSEPDKGIYDAMNKGVKKATGDYCIFMNAGDTFASPTVITQLISKGMDADVIYGDIIKDGNIKRSLSPRNCHKMFYCHQSVFVRTALLRAFPFDIKHKMSADFKQAKQLFLAKKTFKQTDVVVANFDTNGVSNTQRSRGLYDNMSIVWEVDNVYDKIRLLPRLFFTYLMCRLRGK